jgi:diguanylate cyclase (GGDEF)-like protein
MRENTRIYDVAARYGPDEFTLLLPNTTPEKALPVVQRIVQGFRTSHLLPYIPDISISAKYAVVSSEEQDNPGKLMGLLEEKLAEAKRTEEE